MKYKTNAIFRVIIVILLMPLISYSHSGRTDSSGGHYNYSTGEYHYHHGYSPHQHPNGICPYEEDDESDFSEGEIFTGVFSDSTKEIEESTVPLTNKIRELSNKNNELENEINDKKKKINELIVENNNLKEQIDALYYIGISIVVGGLICMGYLFKRINNLKGGDV